MTNHPIPANTVATVLCGNIDCLNQANEKIGFCCRACVEATIEGFDLQSGDLSHFPGAGPNEEVMERALAALD